MAKRNTPADGDPAPTLPAKREQSVPATVGGREVVEAEVE
jgi:hypothetical protein